MEKGDLHSLHRDYELKIISKKDVKAAAAQYGFNNVLTFQELWEQYRGRIAGETWRQKAEWERAKGKELLSGLFLLYLFMCAGFSPGKVRGFYLIMFKLHFLFISQCLSFLRLKWLNNLGWTKKWKWAHQCVQACFHAASLTCLYQIIEAAVRGWVRFVQIGKDSESNLWFGIQGYENIDLAPRLIDKPRLVLAPYLPGDLIDNTFQ